MSIIKFLWKIWLRPNFLTKDVANDMIAEVSTAGKTVGNAEIAHDIKEEGSELSEATICDVLTRADHHSRRRLQEGYSVQTGLVHVQPRVKGSWIGEHPAYNPAVHKLTADATLTAETRAALEEVTVEVLGTKPDGGAYIHLVTDVATGKTDGAITPGEDIIVEGDRLKIAPEGEIGLGVFFVAQDGTIFPAVGPHSFNTPKKLIIRVPKLEAGGYTLRVITRFSQSSILLKEPRAIEYPQLLVVQ
jgi:hypothetical protein